ncbi:MAG: DUF2937 family protein [Maritimibacter sp.]
MRILAMAGGIAGAVALSQFPEFSQQYMQRLAGARDELRAVTVAFDLTAKASNLSREDALIAMGGSTFQNRLADDMRARITRFERLDADYSALSTSLPLERLAQFWRIRDAELIERTWDDYAPAVPVTSQGLISTAIGYVIGWGLITLILSFLTAPLRRRTRA